MRVTRGRIERQKVPSPAEVEQRQTNRLFEELREVLEAAEFKKHDQTIDDLLRSGHSATDIASALIHLLNLESGRQNEPITEDRPQQEGRGYPRYERREFPQGEGRGRGPRTDNRDFRDDRGPRRPFQRDFNDRPPRREFRDDRGPDFDRRPGPPRRGDFNEGPPSRSHEPGMTRLTLNLGHENNLGPGDVVGFIANSANLDRTAIGAINIMGRQSFVDVATDKVNEVLSLSGQRLKGKKLLIKAGY